MFVQEAPDLNSSAKQKHYVTEREIIELSMPSNQSLEETAKDLESWGLDHGWFRGWRGFMEAGWMRSPWDEAHGRSRLTQPDCRAHLHKFRFVLAFTQNRQHRPKPYFFENAPQGVFFFFKHRLAPTGVNAETNLYWKSWCHSTKPIPPPLQPEQPDKLCTGLVTATNDLQSSQ